MSECSTLLTSRSGVCSVGADAVCTDTHKKVPFLFSNLYITCKREKLPVTFGQSSCFACAFPSSVSGGDANVPFSFRFYLNITFYDSLTVPFLAPRGQKWRDYLTFFCGVAQSRSIPDAPGKDPPATALDLCARPRRRGAPRRCSLTVITNPNDLRTGALCPRTPLGSDCTRFRLPPLAERLSVPIPLPATTSVTKEQPLF